MVRVARVSAMLALLLTAPAMAAEGGAREDVREAVCRLRPASPESAPWARSLFGSGDGGGAGLDAPLTVIQTEYSDPVDGNVVLLLWNGATPGAELDVYLDGKNVGTVTDPGLAFLPEVSPGPHAFRIEDPAAPGSVAEGALRVLDEQPFEDPGSVQCGRMIKDGDFTCSVEVTWTNPASGPLPSYHLVFGDDERGLTTDSGAETSITLEGISPGLHDVTLVGFLRESPGSTHSLYRGRLLGSPCDIGSCDPTPRFVRGSCGGSGDVIDISNAVFALSFLFVGGATPACLAACDSDANGIIVITDPVYLLNYLFLGGPPPVGWVDEDRDGTVDPFCETASPEQCALGQSVCAADS